MLSHSLFRLTQQLYNRPHCITPQAFDVILDHLNTRNTVGAAKANWDEGSNSSGPQEKPYANGIGVLKIDGSLTYKPVMTLCGEVGTSYQSLVAQVEEMAEAGVKTLVMEVNSGGGEAGHCFETANEIRAIMDENNIRSIAYIDTIGASAAYALACIADEVIANPSADVGSVGVVVALMDTSKAYEQAGLKRIFITSGDSKVPFSADGSFKEEFLNGIQESVDRLSSEFFAHVSKYTGLPVDAIMGLEAKCFDADVALSHGLVNRLMTNKQFIAYVADVHKGI